jgi:hypothetical protein
MDRDLDELSACEETQGEKSNNIDREIENMLKGGKQRALAHGNRTDAGYSCLKLKGRSDLQL